MEGFICTYLSAPIECCPLGQCHVNICVHLSLKNHLAAEMGHQLTKPQGELWSLSGRKKSLSTGAVALSPNLPVSSLEDSNCVKAPAAQNKAQLSA